MLASFIPKYHSRWMAAGLLPTFRRRKSRYSVPEGMRIYAIGDVHGCLDQLNRMLDAIDKDLGSRPVQSQLIFLGDLVDRGPRSAEVVERVLHGDVPTSRCGFIMGNHEEVMLECYKGATENLGTWLHNGGVETLASYGVELEDIFAGSMNLVPILRRAIPEPHIEFLESFQDYVRVGDYLFVHAGIRPGVPMDAQSKRDLRWIRGPFLDDSTDHGFMVVHGHSIVPNVEFHANRIAIDTGCFFSGRLSAVALEADSARVISVE